MFIRHFGTFGSNTFLPLKIMNFENMYFIKFIPFYVAKRMGA